MRERERESLGNVLFLEYVFNRTMDETQMECHDGCDYDSRYEIITTSEKFIKNLHSADSFHC